MLHLPSSKSGENFATKAKGHDKREEMQNPHNKAFEDLEDLGLEWFGMLMHVEVPSPQNTLKSLSAVDPPLPAVFLGVPLLLSRLPARVTTCITTWEDLFVTSSHRGLASLKFSGSLGLRLQLWSKSG